MKFIVGCFISAFLAVLFTKANAQGTPASIQGKVLTETHNAEEDDTIILLKDRKSVV